MCCWYAIFCLASSLSFPTIKTKSNYLVLVNILQHNMIVKAHQEGDKEECCKDNRREWDLDRSDESIEVDDEEKKDDIDLKDRILRYELA